jgi:hypothetical protein
MLDDGDEDSEHEHEDRTENGVLMTSSLHGQGLPEIWHQVTSHAHGTGDVDGNDDDGDWPEDATPGGYLVDDDVECFYVQ